MASSTPVIAKPLVRQSRYSAISISVSEYGGPGLIFDIRELINDRVDRLYCAAKSLDINELIVIKFTRQNSIELHKFCLDTVHAPSIRGFERS